MRTVRKPDRRSRMRRGGFALGLWTRLLAMVWRVPPLRRGLDALLRHLRPPPG